VGQRLARGHAGGDERPHRRLDGQSDGSLRRRCDPRHGAALRPGPRPLDADGDLRGARGGRPYRRLDRQRDDRLGRWLLEHGRALRSRHGYLVADQRGGCACGSKRTHRGVDGIADDRLGRRRRRAVHRPLEHGGSLRPRHGYVVADLDGRCARGPHGAHRGMDRADAPPDDRLGRQDRS
jgi:hypothetical protein